MSPLSPIHIILGIHFIFSSIQENIVADSPFPRFGPRCSIACARAVSSECIPLQPFIFSIIVCIAFGNTCHNYWLPLVGYLNVTHLRFIQWRNIIPGPKPQDPQMPQSMFKWVGRGAQNLYHYIKPLNFFHFFI